MRNMQYKIWCLNSVCYESWTFQTSVDVRALSTNVRMHINPGSTDEYRFQVFHNIIVISYNICILFLHHPRTFLTSRVAFCLLNDHVGIA
jgi:hypothetical protein